MGWQDIFLPELEWQSITPELVVLLFGLLAPIVAMWDTDRRGMQQFALIGLGGSFILTLGSLLEWHFNIPGIGIRFTLEYLGSDLRGAFLVNEASQTLKLVFLGTAFLAVLGAGRPIKGPAEADHGEFHSLILFATLGMMIVASAGELITLLLGIEIASMSSYLLAGFKRDKIASEAAMKYFLIGAASSGMTLFAISLLYGATGTTSLVGIREALAAGGAFDAISLVAIVLLIAGLGFKISSVPFHAWAPDVYEGSPVPVAGMLAAGSKAMGFFAVFQVFLVALAGVKANWELAVALVAVATMFTGNLVALRQDSVRRMLAYSSIAQAGYLLIAVAVGTTFAVGGGVLHLMVNAAMKLGAFLVVGALIYAGIPDHVDGYKGLGRRSPFLAFAMAIFLLSMAGIPPLGGFTSKFVLFSSAIDVGVVQHLGWLVWLAVFAVLNSAISLYYYLRIIRNMYVEGFGAAGDEAVDTAAGRQASSPVPVDTAVKVAIGTCVAFVILVGVYPAWFVDAAMEAAATLMGA